MQLMMASGNAADDVCSYSGACFFVFLFYLRDLLMLGDCTKAIYTAVTQCHRRPPRGRGLLIGISSSFGLIAVKKANACSPSQT